MTTQEPFVQYLDILEVDPDKAYLDAEGRLHFLPAPRVWVTREELEVMCQSEPDSRQE